MDVKHKRRIKFIVDFLSSLPIQEAESLIKKFGIKFKKLELLNGGHKSIRAIFDNGFKFIILGSYSKHHDICMTMLEIDRFNELYAFLLSHKRKINIKDILDSSN
jgi:hypothetical protein